MKRLEKYLIYIQRIGIDGTEYQKRCHRIDGTVFVWADLNILLTLKEVNAFDLPDNWIDINLPLFTSIDLGLVLISEYTYLSVVSNTKCVDVKWLCIYIHLHDQTIVTQKLRIQIYSQRHANFFHRHRYALQFDTSINVVVAHCCEIGQFGTPILIIYLQAFLLRLSLQTTAIRGRWHYKRIALCLCR